MNISVDILDEPRFVAAGPGTLGFWAGLMCWSHAHETDGFVEPPLVIFGRRVGHKELDALVECRLLVREADAWILPDYVPWNGTRESRAEDRRRAREHVQASRRRSEVILRHGMVCHLCGAAIEDLADLHVDHDLPLSRGGTSDISNLKPSHATCNMRKGNRLPGEL